MSDWRHVEDMYGACFHLLNESPYGWTDVPCGCSTPTPDPNSPCGFDYGGGMLCGLPGDDEAHQPPVHPPYVPTRCTCGHAIERAR